VAKSPDAFRTISEVAEWLNTPAHVLRFWESKFIQIKPVKRAGGRRYYRPGDMLLLGGIKKLLHEDGMTIKGAQKLLRSDGIKKVAALSQPLDTSSDGDGAAAPVKKDVPAAAEVATQHSEPSEPDLAVEQPMLMELDEKPPVTDAPTPDPKPAARMVDAPQTAPLPLEDTEVDIADETAKQQKLAALYNRLSALRDRMQSDIGA